MSKRRRKSGVGFDLFAFQDAVTSTTGVLLMITLILVLTIGGARIQNHLEQKLQQAERALAQERAREAQAEDRQRGWERVLQMEEELRERETLLQEIQVLEIQVQDMRDGLADAQKEAGRQDREEIPDPDEQIPVLLVVGSKGPNGPQLELMGHRTPTQIVPLRVDDIVAVFDAIHDYAKAGGYTFTMIALRPSFARDGDAVAVISVVSEAVRHTEAITAVQFELIREDRQVGWEH